MEGVGRDLRKVFNFKVYLVVLFLFFVVINNGELIIQLFLMRIFIWEVYSFLEILFEDLF